MRGVRFLLATLWTFGSLGALCALLHLLPRVGLRRVTAWLERAPGLDLVMTLFVAVPLIALPLAFGWAGFAGAVVGQLLALAGWTVAHELAHPEARAKPRIVKVHNALLGPFRTQLALYVMLPAVPLFWVIRVAEWTIYPPLVWIARLPPYRQAEWVNVSRHKFAGLVGHDRVWCLYCDWMTGLWSLGSEMLRNIESFWCPVRFQSDLKCANCRLDFPDVDGGWAPFGSDAAEAARVVQAKYADAPRPPSNAWFGHPVRLTVKGAPADAKVSGAA